MQVAFSDHIHFRPLTIKYSPEPKLPEHCEWSLLELDHIVIGTGVLILKTLVDWVCPFRVTELVKFSLVEEGRRLFGLPLKPLMETNTLTRSRVATRA